jgi:HNH endonuclease
MAVSKRLRYEILRRDNNTCRYCGQSAPDVKLTVDHVVPTALGGSDDPSNLVAACKDCNAGKSASAPDAAIVADVDEKAVRWSQAMHRVLEQREAELAKQRARTQQFEEHWLRYRSQGQPVPRPANWKSSVLQFLAGGLDDEFLRDAVDTAMGTTKVNTDSVWRYFCGICWRELDKIQEEVSKLADTESAEETPAAAPARKGLHPMFDDLYFAEHFIAAMLGCFGVEDDELASNVIDAFWLAMAETYTKFVAGPTDVQASEVPEVFGHFKSLIEPAMWALIGWRQRELVPDGS